MKMIIVLDLGTTSTKTALLDEQGTISAEFSIDTPTMFDKNRMEIDQNILWNGILNMIAKLNRVVKKGDTLAGITISSMSNSIIPVDRQGRSLHFALSWLDKRPYEKYVVPFLKRFIEGYSIPSCGQYPLAMYPAFKIAWYRENFPEKNKNVFKWVNISDFIYAKMLGQTDQYFCDYSIASRYMLFDDNKKKWNPHALKEFSIDESLLPSPVCAGSILGNAGPELRKLGINSSAKIIMGAHDHICASICANIHSTEKILHSTGTSEVLTTIFQGKNNTLPPKKWLNVESSIDNNEKYLVAFCSASGQIFKSFSSALKSNNCLEDKKILSAQDTLSSRPIFIPPVRSMESGLAGSLTQFPGIFGLDELWQSVIEGFAFECKRNLDRIISITEGKPQLIISVGGQTRNDLMNQLRCDILGIPLERYLESNVAIRGSFIIAAVTLGLFNNSKEASEKLFLKLERKVFVPNRVSSEIYENFYYEKYLSQFDNGINSL